MIFSSALMLADAAWAQTSDTQTIHQATTVQTFPDIEQQDGRDTLCGIRVLFSASAVPLDFALYDLTIAMYVSESQKGLTAVRATMRRGDLSTDPNLTHAARIQPTDMVFGVAPFKSPVGLRDRRAVDGILVATIDESKAPKPGDYGGGLIRHLLRSEPVLVVWSDASGAPQSISIKAPNNPMVFDAMRSCLKGSLPLDE